MNDNLNNLTVKELKALATSLKIKGRSQLTSRAQLIKAISDTRIPPKRSPTKASPKRKSLSPKRKSPNKRPPRPNKPLPSLSKYKQVNDLCKMYKVYTKQPRAQYLKSCLKKAIFDNDYKGVKLLVDYGTIVDHSIFEYAIQEKTSLLHKVNTDDKIIDYLLLSMPINVIVIEDLSIYLKYKQLKKLLRPQRYNIKNNLALAIEFNRDAVLNKSLDLIYTAQVLLKHGSDPNPDKINGLTLLEIAAKANNFVLVKLLLKYGAEITDEAISLVAPGSKTENPTIYNYILRFKRHHYPDRLPTPHSQMSVVDVDFFNGGRI